MRLTIFSFLFLLFTVSLQAARVDSLQVYSASMKKSIPTVIVLPEDYTPSKTYPVIYLLHGYSGNYRDFITRAPQIQTFADSLSILFVCADGNYGSWYFDSPLDSSWRYETYITQELIPYIDKHFSTVKDRKGRAITGLSMGGHGAFYLAFRHQPLFGAAGSLSGGVDFRPFPQKWDIAKRLGEYATHKQNWEENTVINLVHLLTPNSLALIFDCGTGDFFYEVNKNLHDKMLERNIPHDFISRPGAHNWDYWRNAIDYQVLYFHHYFKS